MSKPTIITGIERVGFAVQTQDDINGLVYDVPELLKNPQELAFKPKQNIEPLYAENKIIEQGVAFQQADIELSLASFTSAQRAKVLGQTIAANGGVYATSSDIPPYVALLYKATIAGGYRYGIFYKGLFQIPDEDIKGQEGKIAYAAPKLAATFIPTAYNGIWEYHVDTTDPNCPTDIDNTWFASVVIPTADTMPPTVTVTPVDGATAVSKSTNIVWTFSKAISPSRVTAANFFLIEAVSGNLVSGTLTLDGTGKIVTFDPTSDLSTATAYIAVATSNITDTAGNRLAANSITNFTTA